MRKLSILVIFFSLLIYSNASGQNSKPASKHFTIQQIASGVWVAINNDQYGHAICNAGIVDLGDKTLIFDPLMNLDAAKDLKLTAARLTHKQASIIVNSHYHNDHIRGNQVFLPATIIASFWTRNQIPVSEREELTWEKENATKLLALSTHQLDTATGLLKVELPLWIGYYEGMVVNGPQIKTTVPDLAFSDSLWIYGTARNVKLVELENVHTKSDVILVIPDCGVVFMGDLLFVKRHPWLGDGKPEKWIQHLQNIYDNDDLKSFLPGHGPMAGKAEVNTMIQYISELSKLVKDQLQQKMPDSLIQNAAIPARFSDWKFQRFFVPNLQVLSKELRAKMKLP